MPFEKIRSKCSLTEEVSVSKSKECHVSVNIKKEIADKIGWKDNSKFEFLWGTGDEKGFMKVVQMQGGIGWNNLEKLRSTRYLTTGRVPRNMIKEKMGATEVEYKIEGKALLITLPKYFYEKQP